LQAIERFRYHAATLGVSGQIRQPFEHAICPQADVTLPESGGFVHSRVDNFNFRDLIIFDRAVAFAAGSFSVKDDAFDATAAVTIEGLNILNVITADRVTARIASSHPRSGAEPRITPIGSSFENLRIAGHKVEVDLAVDTFTEFDTASELRSACEDNDVSGRVQPHVLSTNGSGEMSFTLVRSLRGLGKEITVSGNTIRIRDFGVVRLAEIFISERKRRVSMVQFNLGSTPEGEGQAGGAEGNGSAN
jgi:hypothetical protein